MDLKINWDHKRCKHVIERMWLRSISQAEIKEALILGQKHKQKSTGLMESFHKFYSVVYQEFVDQKNTFRKIYPVTVKQW